MKSLAKGKDDSSKTLGELLEQAMEGGLTEKEQEEKEEKKEESSNRSDLKEGMWWENIKIAIGKRAAPGTLGQSPTPTPEMMAGQPLEPAIKKAKTSN